jgi:serine/threonine-protein kinase
VAIKVLHPDLAATLGADRFLREIEITARLSHPLILPLLDSGEVANHLYYVIPFVSGPSLRDRLSDDRPPPIDEIVFITG